MKSKIALWVLTFLPQKKADLWQDDFVATMEDLSHSGTLRWLDVFSVLWFVVRSQYSQFLDYLWRQYQKTLWVFIIISGPFIGIDESIFYKIALVAWLLINFLLIPRFISKARSFLFTHDVLWPSGIILIDRLICDEEVDLDAVRLQEPIRLLQRGEHIRAVKYIREETGVSLKHANLAMKKLSKRLEGS